MVSKQRKHLWVGGSGLGAVSGVAHSLCTFSRILKEGLRGGLFG